MTPEEQFNKDAWYVLKKIKERSLYTKKYDPISYWVNFDFIDLTGETPTLDNEVAVLEKLEESGVIKIQNKGGTWEYI